MSRVGIRGQQRLLRHHLRSLLAVRPLERLYAGCVRGQSDEPVLVRQLLPGLPDDQRDETAALFEPHLVRLSRLRHPGALPLREHSDGPIYLVTDVPYGTTIGELVRDAGSLPTSTVINLGLAIAEVLAAAHAHGVLHAALRRDLILVRTDGTVTVLDLGLVPMLLDRTNGRLRRVHVAWDSLFPDAAAVAPEILSGDPVTEATDVYGLGALLYLLATATMPYEGRAVVVYNAILSGQQPVDPRNDLPELDEGLADLISRCLARRPEDRPANIAAVRGALARLATENLEDSLAPLAPVIGDRPYTERFRPLLRVVQGGDGSDEPDDPEPSPGVVPLFSDTPPMSEAELLARMSAEQREIYFAGSALHERPDRRGQTRRGMVLGLLLTVLLLVLAVPQLIDSPSTTRKKGSVELAPPPPPPLRLEAPSSPQPRRAPEPTPSAVP